MLKASKDSIRLRWIVLGISVHGLAAALVLPGVLSSSPTVAERDAPAPLVLAPVEAPEPTARAVAELVAPLRFEQRSAQVPALPEAEVLAQVDSVTAALVAALEAPEFEDAIWREEVVSRAQLLDPAALPALERLLADDTRTVEEHVAASELVAVLRAR